VFPDHGIPSNNRARWNLVVAVRIDNAGTAQVERKPMITAREYLVGKLTPAELREPVRAAILKRRDLAGFGPHEDD
jgi:hypothetical protein